MTDVERGDTERLQTEDKRKLKKINLPQPNTKKKEEAKITKTTKTHIRVFKEKERYEAFFQKSELWRAAEEDEEQNTLKVSQSDG